MQLVDAWEPLYRSLAPDQKQRMRILMARVMPALLSAAVDARHLSDYDENDDDVYVYVPDPAAVGARAAIIGRRTAPASPAVGRMRFKGVLRAGRLDPNNSSPILAFGF